jgi:ribosomal protein S18 acetylase RimI-like enzyme
MTTIRRAIRDDIPALAKTLAAAFAEYAWTRWTVPADDHLARLEALFALDMAEIGLVHDEVWTTDDCSAVAVWVPPAELQSVKVNWERHARLSAPLLAERLAVADAADEIIAVRRPAGAHWYLATTGVHPDHQRQGLGTKVMEPVLSRCDAAGMPCLTETSTPENVAFYERLGFRTLHEVAMPDDGPTVWVMWRDPHRTSS